MPVFTAEQQELPATEGGLTHEQDRYPSPAGDCGPGRDPKGRLQHRKNGQLESRNTANIEIVSKTDKSGIDIHIKAGTKNQSVHIPVIITETGLDELVYNDFYIGPDCDVVIVAGCGIHNAGDKTSQHDGVHTFYVGENSKVQYVEKHYGEGEGTGERIMNPQTVVYLEKGASIQLDTTQLRGGLHQTLHQSGNGEGRGGSGGQ